MSADPQHDQRRASDPEASIFVTANAGSGKTTTLVDRVARLLLGGAQPEAILCVTYTKAAAAEMQRRLFDRLGKWSVMEDVDLRAPAWPSCRAWRTTTSAPPSCRPPAPCSPARWRRPAG